MCAKKVGKVILFNVQYSKHSYFYSMSLLALLFQSKLNLSRQHTTFILQINIKFIKKINFNVAFCCNCA